MLSDWYASSPDILEHLLACAKQELPRWQAIEAETWNARHRAALAYVVASVQRNIRALEAVIADPSNNEAWEEVTAAYTGFLYYLAFSEEICSR